MTVIKAYEGAKVKLHSLLTSALAEDEWSALLSGRFIRG